MDHLEQKIQGKVRYFTIQALLQLLHHIGYGNEDILFKSNVEQVSNPSLLEAVEFKVFPKKHVVITVNMGLLHPQGSAPSYFSRALDIGLVEDQAFLNFIGFFDHNLIANYINNIYPEYNIQMYSDWEVVKSYYIKLLGLNSKKTLHWMFQLIYPELGISVELKKHDYKLQGSQIQLGKTSLGSDAIFGSFSNVPLSGFDIVIYCETEYCETNKPWVDESHDRLKSNILPILKDVAIYLKIDLVIRSQKGWLQLKEGSYFGVDRIRGGQKQSRRVLIFKGLTSKVKLS